MIYFEWWSIFNFVVLFIVFVDYGNVHVLHVCFGDVVLFLESRCYWLSCHAVTNEKQSRWQI